MTPDQIDLARRAVACQRWRWVPGMLSTDLAALERAAASLAAVWRAWREVYP